MGPAGGGGGAQGSNAPPSAPSATASEPFSSRLMMGGWTQRAFHASHDGKTTIAIDFGGFEVIQGNNKTTYAIPTLPGMRMVMWAPDNKRFIFWHPEGVAVANVENLGNPLKPNFTLVYKLPKGRRPFGAGWCPGNNDVFVVEHVDPTPAAGGSPATPGGSALKRVSASGGNPVEILNHPHQIDFFMPPQQRYENGSGPGSTDYLIVIGARDGIYVIDRNGGKKQKVVDQTSFGIQDIVWSPKSDVNKFAFLYRQSSKSADGKKIVRGVYLVHLDRVGKKGEVVEQLDESLDVHTLYFAHHGKYLAWSSPQSIAIREPDAPPDKTNRIGVQDFKAGNNAVIKGFGWDHTDTRIAIAVSNRLYVYNVEKKTWQFLVKVGDEAKVFIAEPTWIGDDVAYSTFTNTALPKKRSAPGK